MGCGESCQLRKHAYNWHVDVNTDLFTQLSRNRPYERCDECGSVYKMRYIGPATDDEHGHDHHHGVEDPKTMADYVKQDYWYR